ncbi:hypothetical protein LTR36_010586 [Oleoguttula mirabilis]|uniref:F-box domain-containing protein n=1 Tax=Oleoguttula mirabilis TaxID=1507867 RepID=A0AAV9JS81_9PEZI|nr:hypothetical protein LTR36_010586 [Oleoguttula mirabilis]
MGLIDLPPELVMRVSSLLTTSELGNLRSSCHHIEAVLFNSFAKEFFTKRQFMLEHVSLQALVDISRHPTLSKRLKEVIIGLDVLHTDSGYASEASKAIYRAGHVSQGVLLETGQARDMLVEAFSNLPNLSTVGLRDYDGAGRFRDGPNARWRSYGWSYGTIEDAELAQLPLYGKPRLHPTAESAFALILYSLGKALSTPTNVEVFLRRRSKLTPSALNLVAGSMGTTITPVLAGLTTLMLTVALSERMNLDTPPMFDSNDSVADMPLKTLLHHTPNLQTLRINFDTDQFLAQNFLEWLGKPAVGSPWTKDYASGTVSPAALTKLTNLDFGMCNVSGPTLVQVVTKFNLKSLNLWKVALRCKDLDEMQANPACWAQFFTSLANALPTSTGLKSVMVGYCSQCYYPNRTTPGLGQYLRVHFAPEADRSAKTPLDTVRYRSAYGTDVRDWLRSIAKRSSVPKVCKLVSDSDEDHEDEDDSDGGDVDGGEEDDSADEED